MGALTVGRDLTRSGGVQEETLDEMDFQIPIEYTSTKLEKVRHDNVIVINDSLQIDEYLSQSLLAKSRRRKSSLSEYTNAFASDNINNTKIETSIDSQNIL